ncbi:unnamed protein product [Arctia plantaginis]|uniref:Cuticle protein n=1 Tax=Arctia plantaginis TaxID=874455 RepID=A0A8S1AXL7_ARCPL|nr:unnamed protein product [Arctia plantaginis]
MKSMVVFFALCAVAYGSLVAPAHLPVVTSYAPSVVVAPSYGYNAPLLPLGGLGYGGRSHYLYKRSLGHYAVPAAVSHQSRVDVVSSPAVVSHAVAAPIVAHAPVVAAVPSAVSHQSRVDIHSSPAVVAQAAVVPAVAPLSYAAPYSHGYGYAAAPYNHGYYNSAPWAHAW